MTKTVFELAKEYYPKLWNKERIEALHDAGKLTDEQYEDLVGKEDSE